MDLVWIRIITIVSDSKKHKQIIFVNKPFLLMLLNFLDFLFPTLANHLIGPLPFYTQWLRLNNIYEVLELDFGYIGKKSPTRFQNFAYDFWGVCGDVWLRFWKNVFPLGSTGDEQPIKHVQKGRFFLVSVIPPFLTD